MRTSERQLRYHVQGAGRDQSSFGILHFRIRNRVRVGRITLHFMIADDNFRQLFTVRTDVTGIWKDMLVATIELSIHR